MTSLTLSPIPDAFPDVIDLFAGPGGWSTAAKGLGLTEVGVEWDAAAIATARAAGHPRVSLPWDPAAKRKRGTFDGPPGPDIATLDPRAFASSWFGRPPRGLIASPPCQGFSTAGKGKGRDDSVHLLRVLADVHTASDLRQAMPHLRSFMTDERSLLVLEPLRWALALTPSWLAWEQVPAVLPLWEACARVLRGIGYSVATGNVQAEQYGVPQTRRRAILVARAPWFAAEHGPAQLPTPTHSRYYSRTPARLDDGVEKWVSMAEALGAAYLEGSIVSNYGTGGDPAARGERTTDQPAATVTSKVDRNKWLRGSQRAEGGTDSVDAEGYHRRSTEAPAQTITSTVRSFQWSPEFNDQSGTEFDPTWPEQRPATAVAGRGLVQNPGATANRMNGSTKSRNDGVRVTVAEASVLQSFPADYPWQGTGSAQYRQVGDAVPPRLAWHVLREVAALDVELPEEWRRGR